MSTQAYETAKRHALMVAQSLGVGESVYDHCPICARRQKFSVTRQPDGVLWQCFRATCPAPAGFAPSGLSDSTASKKITAARPWRGRVNPLDKVDREYFAERFGISTVDALATIRKTGDWEDKDGIWHDGVQNTRYIFRIMSPFGYTRGHLLRNPTWSGSPRPPLGGWGSIKAQTYMAKDDVPLSWYPCDEERHLPPGTPFYRCDRRLVVVEDVLSAIKVQQAGLSAVALLGTGLSNNKVAEMIRWRPEEVIIALDADATDQAFRHARKYGLAFPRTRVAILEQDLKDTPASKIREVLGV